MRSLLAALIALLVLPASASAAERIDVGVGRADITPPTGYYAMGWVRSDAKLGGQHTRLWTRVIVLRQGGRKVALVSQDLGSIAGGVVAQAAEMNRDLGYSQENVLVSASHTHAAPTGYFNFSTFNTVFMTIRTPTDFQLTGEVDPQLYAFMVRRLALAIRRADQNLGPGAVGWGATSIEDLTANRSLEAHLGNHGLDLGYGEGSPALDPDGALHTIDPDASVLRVDKYFGRRRVPVGVWSAFANHGTVNRFQFNVYNADHHGSATRVVESAIRRAGKVPRTQAVVNAFGNTDEGDMSSGLTRRGPAAADYVGRVEAAAFMHAWREAGRSMRRDPALDLRWTRMCFCGQDTKAGPVADRGAFGLAQFTGSEEGRGPLFDITRQPFEGQHLPIGAHDAAQGNKIAVPIPADVPTAVPLFAVRIGDRVIVSIPGEMTVDMGRRVRASVLDAMKGSGVTTAVISGLANEYADYFTTPEEYDQQHYEGAANVFGRTSGVALEEALAGMAGKLAAGQPAPEAYPFDPTNGLKPDAEPFPMGAASASVTRQPDATAARLTQPAFEWRGGPRGFDRPLDSAFVLVQRQVTVRTKRKPRRTRPRRRGPRRGGGRQTPAFTGKVTTKWKTADSDLGLHILWTADEDGAYHAHWEVPRSAPLGTYRFVVRANGYSLASTTFRVEASRALTAVPVQGGVELRYPQPSVRQDVGDPPGDVGATLAHLPARASSGRATFVSGGRSVTVRASRGGVFAGSGDLRAGAVRDAYGNANANALTVPAP